MLGAILAICSAATFGFNNAAMRRGVLRGTVFQALSVTVPIGVPLFLLASLVTGQLGNLFGFGWTKTGYLAAAGVLHFVWGRYWNYQSVVAMGANLSGSVQQFSLLASLGFAMVFLDEHLTLPRLLGIALVVGGPFIMTSGLRRSKGDAGEADSKSGGGGETPKPVAFQPNLFRGFVAGFLGMFGYGLSPILVRMGLADNGASLAGGAISYIAATLVLALFILLSGRLYQSFTIDRTAVKWFTVSGVFVFFAQMFSYLALAIAPVTVVAPIQRLSLVFRISLSTLINREYEVFNTRVVIGMVVSLIGAVSLTLSMAMIADLFSLPLWALNWRWP
jgi:uncharacterized membrane protein